MKNRKWKWYHFLIIGALIAWFTWMGVSAQADKAVVNAGDAIYEGILTERAEAEYLLEILSEDVNAGRMGIAAYLAARVHLEGILRKQELVVMERQYLDSRQAGRHEIADLYREVFDWKLFPP